MADTQHRGLVFLDVDGVIFHRQLMVALARLRGTRAWLRTVGDGLLFEMGRLTVHQLLRRAYGRMRGLPWEEAWDCYRRMPLTPGALETVRELKANGMTVVLLTAGVPDPMVKDLVARLGADGGAGMTAHLSRGRLSGRISGELTHDDGKLRHASRLVEQLGVRWADVCAIGDDRNNLPLLMAAGTGIGFNATTAVRRRVEYLVDDDHLTATLRFALPGQRLGRALAEQTMPERRPWHREILRKVVHLTSALVPLLAATPASEAASLMPAAVSAPGRLVAASLLVLWCIALYLVSECFRLYGRALPVVRWLERRVMRRHERRELAEAPLALAAGVLLALWCFPAPIGLACVLIVAVADSVASVVGTHWGRLPWLHNPLKTVEGSGAFFAAALVCASVYLPLPSALMVAAIAAAVESLPLQDWDNFLTPAATGLVSSFLLGGFA